MLCEQRNATAGADRHLKVKQTGSRCQRFCLLPGNRVGISEVSRKLLPNLKEPNLNNFKFKSSLGVLIDNSLLTPCSPVPYPHRPVPNAALGGKPGATHGVGGALLWPWAFSCGQAVIQMFQRRVVCRWRISTSDQLRYHPCNPRRHFLAIWYLCFHGHVGLLVVCFTAAVPFVY